MTNPRRNPRRPHLFRLEALEDRTVPSSVSVVEDFESDLSNYQTALRFAPSAVILPIAAHDGYQGLVKQDGYEWMVRDDATTQVHQGDTVSVWTQFADAADGRAYLGFDAKNNGNLHSPISTSGALAVVLAANTNQLLIQKDSGGSGANTGLASFTTVASASQTYQAGHWYRVEATWGAGGVITANLYDSDGVTLLNTASGTTTAPFPTGGVAFRAFGHDKYFDSVVVDAGSAGSAADRASAGGGLGDGWTAGDPPRPVGNGPAGDPAPVPWAYTSTPGSGIEIQLADFSQLQQVAIVGSRVGLAAANNSLNTGTVQVGWGDPLETPLLAQYLFRQLPGDQTRLIGASSVKHFFSSARTDYQHLNPGESDIYGAGLNATQSYYTYGSELDPVTGTLHSPIDRGTLSSDGIVVNQNRTFTDRIQYLLQANVADLDPAQNPAGTRWFLMGNEFVGGEQDVAQASRWTEIVPHFSGTAFTFSYLGTGTLNFRTIPGLVDPNGPVVLGSSPTGTVTSPVDHVHFVFDRPMDPTTFDPSELTVSGPNGAVNVTGVVDVAGSNDTAFDFTIDTQGLNGNYSYVLAGGTIADPDGHTLRADYSGSFAIAGGPQVLSFSPSGNVSGPVDHVTVTFDRAIDATTFTPAQVSTFVDPTGTPITVTSVTEVDGSGHTQFDVNFDPQAATGSYTLTLTTGITDLFGNPLLDHSTDQLVVNGGFEAGNFSGWTQSGDLSATGVGNAATLAGLGGTVHGGTYAAYFGPAGGLGYLAQTLATTAGRSYTVDFWLSHPYSDTGRGVRWQLTAGGNVLADVSDPGNFDYTEFRYQFTATGSSTELKFGFVEPPQYFFLDDVTVRPNGGGLTDQFTIV
jgi:hypothetical protein